MLQLYIDLASSRLARHAIQPIQLYSYTAIHAIQHTALYSLPQVCAGPDVSVSLSGAHARQAARAEGNRA